MGIDIYPAIDLRHGQVVRLQLGDPAKQTTFSDNPLEAAERWIAHGALWLHVVNLDGAFDEAGKRNWQVLPSLIGRGAWVQFGGGLRTLDDVSRAVDLGVSRVILGTAAVEEPSLVDTAVQRFGADKIAVGIDARDGVVRTRGWQKRSVTSPVKLARGMAALGIRTVIYTDITRDGVLSGANMDGTRELARKTGLAVIASGGVASLADVRRARDGAADGVAGLIIGRALYDGKVDLAEALALVGAEE